MRYILASTSPRRSELFKKVVSEFEIMPSYADENLSLYFSAQQIQKHIQDSPQELVMMLGKVKGEEVAIKIDNGIVVGSDTGVFFDGKMIGKPKDSKDATLILKELSGESHDVITGVCCILVREGKIEKVSVDFDVTKVKFNSLSNELIEDYVKSGLCFGKAGAYGIQDEYPLVDKFIGSFENVMGFPIELVKKIIGELENN